MFILNSFWKIQVAAAFPGLKICQTKLAHKLKFQSSDCTQDYDVSVCLCECVYVQELLGSVGPY